MVEQVRGALQELILSGEVRAGERLNELELAGRFRISRGPIREAIRALEHARLVTVVPNRGAIVRRVDLPDVLDLYDVRAGLARSAGRLLAARATNAQMTALRTLHERMRRAAATHSVAAFHSANRRFHDAILEFAGNARLREIDQSVRDELQLYIRRGSLGAAQLRASIAEHDAFLEAVSTGDADAAGHALEQHILNGRQRMLDNVQSGES